MTKTIVMADRDRVAEAVAVATTKRQVIILLGLTPGRATYARLDEACERFGLQLPPPRLPDRELAEKICNACRETLPMEAFAIKNTERGQRQGICRSCHAVKRKDHYQRNRSRTIAQVRQRNLAVRLRNITYVVDYFRTHPCVDCGEADPMVLQFDHVRGTKSGNIGHLVRDATIKTLDDEIAKCEVRCANCHFRRTATFGKWTRAVVAQQVGHLPSKQA